MATVGEHRIIQELKRKGISIASGRAYFPPKWIPKRVPSLQEVRKRLSKFKGSLAEEVSRMRDEGR